MIYHFVFAIQNYLRMQGAEKEKLFYQKRESANDTTAERKESLIPFRLSRKMFCYLIHFENIKIIYQPALWKRQEMIL